MLDLQIAPGQFPLFRFVESDDLHLVEQADVLWFKVLRGLDDRALRGVAAQYYEGLWAFNQAALGARIKRERSAPKANPETKEDAEGRLLLSRATLDEEAPLLHENAQAAPVLPHVDPARLCPGRTPVRFAGRAPKCFFAMFKAFMGISLMGRAPEPEFVRQELVNNPSFARTCGFTLPDAKVGYRRSDVPSLRKLEQFDEIMTKNDIWGDAAAAQVRRNLEQGRIEARATLVHDTTHFEANSSFKIAKAPDGNEEGNHQDRSKSQSRATKRCRCQDRDTCAHEWTLADDGAGTVVKQRGKMVWAHKASTLCFEGSEVLLQAVAMSDAASHDSKSLVPHLEKLFEVHPDLQAKVTRVLDDGALDDAAIKKQVREKFEIELLTPHNPRARKPIRDNLPRGVDHITSLGVPVCAAGIPLDFLGCRHQDERFLFRAPDDEDGTPVCAACPKAPSCLRKGSERRHVTIPFNRLPFIDPARPHLSRRHQMTMAKRTVIERIHKLMKFDYGDSRLTRRGNDTFQARLDKTLLAMHLVLAVT